MLSVSDGPAWTKFIIKTASGGINNSNIYLFLYILVEEGDHSRAWPVADGDLVAPLSHSESRTGTRPKISR